MGRTVRTFQIRVQSEFLESVEPWKPEFGKGNKRPTLQGGAAEKPRRRKPNSIRIQELLCRKSGTIARIQQKFQEFSTFSRIFGLRICLKRVIWKLKHGNWDSKKLKCCRENIWRTIRSIARTVPISEIPRKFHQHLSNIQWKWSKFVKLCRKMREILTKFCWDIEVWAVQKHVNLVDLVKSFPTNIFLQNLASIQQRRVGNRERGGWTFFFVFGRWDVAVIVCRNGSNCCAEFRFG